MRHCRAFTLVEIVLAVFILMLLVLLAVPSLNGVLADRRLRRSLDSFNNLVRQAQERSEERRVGKEWRCRWWAGAYKKKTMGSEDCRQVATTIVVSGRQS